MKKIQFLVLVLIVITGFVFTSSCSKSDDTPPPIVTDPCVTTPITINISSPVQTSNLCTDNGAISATATGGTTFEYKLDNGSFVSSGNFIAVSAGSHTVTVKNNLGCTKTANVVVDTKPAGTQFLAVKSLMSTKCASCHAGSSAQGNFSFQNECNIITKKSRIELRAVTNGSMPPLAGGGPLTTAQKTIISDWIAGGGTETN
jgi:hypothetical protein